MGEIGNKIENYLNLLNKKHINDDNTSEMLEYFIENMDYIIKPKEEKITYQDITDMGDIFYTIKEDEKLYSLAIKKYKSRIIALECLFSEELNIIKLCELINEEKIWDNQITIEIKYNLNVDELIYLNYLYNITVNSFLENKDVQITLIKKEKNKPKKLIK